MKKRYRGNRSKQKRNPLPKPLSKPQHKKAGYEENPGAKRPSTPKKGFCHSVIGRLSKPSDYFEFELRSHRGSAVIITAVIFGAVGILLNSIWPFPNFAFYTISFSLILSIVFFSLKYFYLNMNRLCAEVIPFRPFGNANHFYLEETESSLFYVGFPFCFIGAFGIGGCVIYKSISYTPTFIWCLIYFTIVVYFSMLAYSQYIRFACYLYKAAHNEHCFENLITPDVKDLPPNLTWLIRITKISHTLNNMFFLVGALYILAFAMFCFSPVYQVQIDAALFYMLWGIIFLFIVLVFPLVSIQEGNDIKKIVAKAKSAYIQEIFFESHLQQAANGKQERMATIMRNYCISIILKAPDYPIDGTLNTISSTAGVIINFTASIVTLIQFQGFQLF